MVFKTAIDQQFGIRFEIGSAEIIRGDYRLALLPGLQNLKGENGLLIEIYNVKQDIWVQVGNLNQFWAKDLPTLCAILTTLDKYPEGDPNLVQAMIRGALGS